MPAWLTKLLGSGIMGGIAASVLAAAGAFLWERAETSGARKERVVWERREQDWLAEKGKFEAQLAGKQLTALDVFIRTRDVSQALAMRSQREIIRYAQTDAGRVLCLDDQRVRGVQDYAGALGFDLSTSADNSAAADPGD